MSVWDNFESSLNRGFKDPFLSREAIERGRHLETLVSTLEARIPTLKAERDLFEAEYIEAAKARKALENKIEWLLVENADAIGLLNEAHTLLFYENEECLKAGAPNEFYDSWLDRYDDWKNGRRNEPHPKAE